MADKTVSVRLAARVDSYVAAMKAAEASTTGFSRSTQRNLRTVGTQMQNVGRMATTFVSLPIAAAGAFAIKAAVDWESAWAGVTKTVDGTAEQLAGLEQGLRDMSKELPATHGEIAAVAEAAGALGVATEDIEFFTRTMIDLGETTDLTSDQAATSIAQMMNVMQTAPDDVDNLASALVHLGNNGASTESQILDMATRIAASGAIVGLSEDEVLGFANALASMGIEAEAGGSAFSRVITDISKAVSQGGDDLDTFARVAGVSASQFAASFREDPASAIVSFVDGLGRIQSAGGDVFTVLDDLGLSDVRVSRALLSMATSGDLLTTSLQQGERAWADNTALADEAAKRYETSAAKFEIVRNKIVDLFIDLGNIMLPVVEAVVDKIGVLAEAFQQLPQPVQIAVGGFLGLAAAAGPVIFIAGSLVKNLVAIRSAMHLLGPAGVTASKALGAIGLAAGLAFAGYMAFTEESRRTEEVSRNVSAALTTNIGALFGAAIAAKSAGESIDGVAIAQEALNEALAEGNTDLADSLASLNVGAQDTLQVLTLFGQAPVTAIDYLARSFGLTAEQADAMARAFDASGGSLVGFNALARSMGEEVGLSGDQLDAVVGALQEFLVAADMTSLDNIARAFLDGRVKAEGYTGSLVEAAEAQADQDRATGSAMAVLIEWSKLVAAADEETLAAATGADTYAEAIAGLPPELQAALSGTEDFTAGLSEMETVAASSIDTMSNLQDSWAFAETLINAYSDGLERALGNSRDWVRAHDGFSASLLTFHDNIEKASAGLDYNTEAGLANREAVFDLADGLIALTESNIQSGRSTEEVTAEYEAGRDALLDAAEAAGLNRDEVEKLITAYGLTPKLISTTVELAGTALSQWRIERYLEKLDEIPADVASEIEALIDQGKYDEAIRLLNSIPDQDVAVRPYLTRTHFNITIGHEQIGNIGGGYAHGGYIRRPEVAQLHSNEVVFPLADPGRIQELWGDPRVSGPMIAALGNLMPAPQYPMVALAAPSAPSMSYTFGDINVGDRRDADKMVDKLGEAMFLAKHTS